MCMLTFVRGHLKIYQNILITRKRSMYLNTLRFVKKMRLLFDYKDPRHNNSRINEYNWLCFYRGAQETIPPNKLEARELSSSFHQYHYLLTGCGMLFCRGNISSSVYSSLSEINGMSFESASLLFDLGWWYHERHRSN